MPLSESVYVVLACDDVDGEDDFAKWFELDARTRRNHKERRRFEIISPVASDPASLIDEVRGRHENRLPPPSVILLDDRINDRKRGTYDYLALETLDWLKQEYREFGEELPLVVLYTTAGHNNDLDLHTFRQMGGANFVDKGWDWERRMEVLWATVLDDARWQHSPELPEVELKRWERAILPALEADLGYEETARWLAEQPEHPAPRLGHDPLDSARDAVRNARHGLGRNDELYHHACELKPGWPGLAQGGSGVTLAMAAVRAGELFIPLRHRHFFEAEDAAAA